MKCTTDASHQQTHTYQNHTYIHASPYMHLYCNMYFCEMYPFRICLQPVPSPHTSCFPFRYSSAKTKKNEYIKNLYFLCFVAGPVYRSYSEFKPSGLKMNTTLPYVLQLDIVVSVSVPLLLYARVG